MPVGKSGNNKYYGLYLYNSQQNPTQQDATQQDATNKMLLNKVSQRWRSNLTGNQRRFSPVQGSATTKGYYTDIETQEGFRSCAGLVMWPLRAPVNSFMWYCEIPTTKQGLELKPVFYWFESPEPKFELPGSDSKAP